jgi:EmrB/QacA subfamily drug resistance transporter
MSLDEDEDADAEPEAGSAELRRIVVVVILGSVMSALDSTIVNVALASLARGFKTSLDSIQWVVTGYLLALAVAIPICGWAARRFGIRRLYLASLVVFTAGSALCGLATSAPELVAFRLLQGAGGGMILPVGQILLVRKSGPVRLARLMSTIGVPSIMAPLIGPTIGGLLIDTLGWRWIFYVNVPIGIAAVVAGRWLLPADRPQRTERFDATGFCLVGLGLVAITYGLAQVGTHDSVAALAAVVPMVSGIALLVGYGFHAPRTPRPVLDLRLYANPLYAASAAAVFCLGISVLGAIILMPLYLQNIRHESALATGLLIIPQGLGAIVSVGLSGRATDRFGAGATALFATLLTLIATIPFTLLGPSTPLLALLAAMLFRGFSQGLSTMPCMTAAYRALKPSEVSDASPQLSVLQRTGGSIGTALFAVVLQHEISRSALTAAAQAAAYATTFVWVMVLAGVAAVAAFCVWYLERRYLPRPG